MPDSHGQAKALRHILIAEPESVSLWELAFTRSQLK